MTQQRVLVTGGAGFIGSHLVDSLLADGHQVFVVDDLSTGNPQNLNETKDGCCFFACLSIAGDGGWIDLANTVLESPPDVIFHLAAIPSVARSLRDPKATMRVNVLGTLQVLEAARKWGSRVVQASSSSVYGGVLGNEPRVETMPLIPLSPYAASKAAAEHLGAAYWNSFEVPVTSLRFFNVFGPRQDPNSQYSAVIPAFVTRAIQGERLLIHGSGKQCRDFTPVGCVVDAIRLAGNAELQNPVINVGLGGSISLLELIEEIESILDPTHKLKVNHFPCRIGDPAFSQADISKAYRLLGYFPPDDAFSEGLRKTIEWFQERS